VGAAMYNLALLLEERILVWILDACIGQVEASMQLPPFCLYWQKKSGRVVTVMDDPCLPNG